MAIGKASDFVIYQEQFHSGATEVMAQQANIFNSASNGAITLSTRLSRGDYVQQAFYQELASLVTRRDTTSVAAVTDIAMTQAEVFFDITGSSDVEKAKKLMDGAIKDCAVSNSIKTGKTFHINIS